MSPTNTTRGGITAAAPRRVFLSHTSDLGKHTEPGSFVAAAIEAVLRARHAVTDMAYFAARDTSPVATCIDMVARSDVYLGIIGLRYGSPVRDRPDVSYTEMEFEAAGDHGQPQLIFLVREDSGRLPRKRQPTGHRTRQNRFRRRLLDSGLTVVRVSAPAELELAVYQALIEMGPMPDAPARLAEAQALLASMPTEVLPDRAPLPAGSRMPLAPNPLFVGRGDELMHVASTLRGGDTTVALGQVVASTGLGGLGKTQLAVELVHRYGRFFAGGVFWLSFASADEIPLQVAGCAGPGLESRPLEERVQRVKDAWQSAMPRLLVFDNCEEETLLDEWRPPSGGCRVLVTSRRSHWSLTLGVASLALDRLPRFDSIQLLRRYRADLAAADPDLDAIARELGDLPLALHLAGSYLRTYRADVSPRDYLVQLRTSEVLDHASLLGRGLDDSPSPTAHVQNLAQTFALSFGRLDATTEVDRVAVALLARMACLAPGEPVPRELLMDTLKDAEPLLRTDGLKRLGDLGLIESSDGWLRLHRLLVHFVRREEVDLGAQSAVEEALIECGRAAAARTLVGAPVLAVIPHLVHMSSAAAEEAAGGRASALRSATGEALQSAGDLAAARPQFERALAIYEGILGPDHPDTANSLNALAWLLREQGDLTAAQPLIERALEIQERVLGPDHPDTAWSLHNLGWLLQERDPAASRAACERALEIRERVLGPDHPDIADSLDVLATTLRAQGEIIIAVALHERALSMRERVLGPDHPSIAWTLYALARLHREKGDFDAAKALCERALEIRERVHGPEHLDVSYSLYDMAELLRIQGELSGAQHFCEHALQIQERVLGPVHSYTTSTRAFLAILRHDVDSRPVKGEYALAMRHFEHSLATSQKVFGPDHPNTATRCNDLGVLLLASGEPAAAKRQFERALAIREGALGPDHVDTATSVHDVALAFQAQGELAAARPLYERALAVRQRVLGSDRPQTATSLNDLALLHLAQGDPAAARPLFQRALAIRERVLGPDHADTVATRRALAELAAEGDGPAAGAEPLSNTRSRQA